MITHEELEKIASSIETDGYSDDRDNIDRKTAQGLFLFNKINSEISSGDYTLRNKKDVTIEKQAGFANKFTEGMAQTALVGLGLAVAGRVADSEEKDYDDNKFKNRRQAIISFAKKENPSLSNVSNGKMKMWLNSAYAISPNVAKDPMLASQFLSTAHAVGGVDLNTAKTVAEIQQRGGKSYNNMYDAVRGASGNISSDMF